MFDSVYFGNSYFDIVYFRPPLSVPGVFGGGGWPMGVFYADFLLR